MSNIENTGPSILLVELEKNQARQNEICQVISTRCGARVTMVNHLIDLPEALSKAESGGFDAGMEPVEPGWLWSVPAVSTFQIILLHTSNPYANAFLNAHPNLLNVLLYSGGPDPEWPRPDKVAAPLHETEFLSMIGEIVGRWKENASLADVLEEIRGERLLREKLFAAGLLGGQLQTQDSGMVENARLGIVALFKPYLEDGITVDAFVNKALRSVPLRVAVKAVLAPEGGNSELWSMIQNVAKSPSIFIAANDGGTGREAVVSVEISQLLKILCRQKKSSKTS